MSRLDAGRRRDRQLAVLAPAVPDSQHHRGRGALPVLPRALRRHGAGDSFRASLPQRAPRAVCADPEPGRGEKRGAPAAGRRRGTRRDRGRTGARGHDPRPARDRLRGDAAAYLRGPGARAGGCAAAGDAGGRGSGRRIEDPPAPASARAVAQRPAGQPRHAARGRGLRRAVGGGALSRGLESSGARRLWAGAGARHGADDCGGRRAVAGPDRCTARRRRRPAGARARAVDDLVGRAPLRFPPLTRGGRPADRVRAADARRHHGSAAARADADHPGGAAAAPGEADVGARRDGRRHRHARGRGQAAARVAGANRPGRRRARPRARGAARPGSGRARVAAAAPAGLSPLAEAVDDRRPGHHGAAGRRAGLAPGSPWCRSRWRG